jgi:hypothetical protein
VSQAYLASRIGSEKVNEILADAAEPEKAPETPDHTSVAVANENFSAMRSLLGMRGGR